MSRTCAARPRGRQWPRLAPLPHDAATQFVEAVLADVASADSSPATSPSSWAMPADAGVSALDLWTAARGVVADALAHNVSDAKLGAALTKAGLPADARDVIATVLSRSRAGAAAAHVDALPALLSGGGGRVLVDWAWEVRHAVSSSSLATTGTTLVRITFTTRPAAAPTPAPATALPSGGPGDTGVASHVVEVAASELEGLIALLEAAAAGMGAGAGMGGVARP